MKHLIGGVLLLAVLLAIGLVSVHFLQQQTGQTCRQLELAKQAIAAEEPQQAEQHAEQARSLWEHQHSFFSAILCHAEMDEITRMFARLRSSLRAGQCDEFYTLCEELMEQVSHLPRMEQARLGNIL